MIYAAGSASSSGSGFGRTFQLNDLTIIGDFPPKLMKALAVIADALHPAFARQAWMKSPDWSKKSCVLASLTCRDFLQGLGFGDAKVRACAVVMRATRNGQELHTLGIGDLPGQPTPPTDHWNGHLVCTVPSARLLLDTTLYNTVRPAWPMMTGMMALKMLPQPLARTSLFGKHPFAVIDAEGRDDGYVFYAAWLDDPANRHWRRGRDGAEWRRQVTLAALRDRFGEWHD